MAAILEWADTRASEPGEATKPMMPKPYRRDIDPTVLLAAKLKADPGEATMPKPYRRDIDPTVLLAAKLRAEPGES